MSLSQWWSVFLRTSFKDLKKTGILVKIHLPRNIAYYNMVIFWKLCFCWRKKHFKRFGKQYIIYIKSTKLPTFRSSQRRCSIKKLFVKFRNIRRKAPVLQFFLISCQSFKKETPTQLSSYEYSKIFKNTYFQEHVRTAVSVL